MREWFAGLAPRERIMVIAAFAVTLAAVFFLAVWEPLDSGVTELEQRVAHERDLAGWVASIGGQAKQLRANASGQVAGRNDSLLSVVDQTSRKGGLGGAVQRIQPQGNDQAEVTLSGAGFNALVIWLRELEQRYGVTVTNLSVSRGDDPGTIDSRMTLKRSAG